MAKVNIFELFGAGRLAHSTTCRVVNSIKLATKCNPTKFMQMFTRKTVLSNLAKGLFSIMRYPIPMTMMRHLSPCRYKTIRSHNANELSQIHVIPIFETKSPPKTEPSPKPFTRTDHTFCVNIVRIALKTGSDRAHLLRQQHHIDCCFVTIRLLFVIFTFHFAS